jgi:hypothetical protein
MRGPHAWTSKRGGHGRTSERADHSVISHTKRTTTSPTALVSHGAKFSWEKSKSTTDLRHVIREWDSV